MIFNHDFILTYHKHIIHLKYYYGQNDQIWKPGVFYQDIPYYFN